MTERPRLVVFAKAPRMGTAKTRLARDVGQVAAMRAYAAMTAGLLRELRDPRWMTVLACAPDEAAHRPLSVWRMAERVEPQGGGDLGDRQARWLTGAAPTIIIGSDCPMIQRRDVVRAFRVMDRKTAVLGPAEDGGYWLIGASGRVPTWVFDGVPWSSPKTLAALTDRLVGLGWRARLMERREDVDDGAALRRWLRARQHR